MVFALFASNDFIVHTPSELVFGHKKEPDASGRGYEQTSQAQATSDSVISMAELLGSVNKGVIAHLCCDR